MEWSAPWPRLEGERVTLVPTTMDDADDLRATCDASTFDHFSMQPCGDDFAGFLRRLLEVQDQRTYTMRVSGVAVGSSTFLDLRPAHRGLEIGFTWIAPAWRETFVNPSAKLLMMRHAFDMLGCLRVQLKCDARNARSAAAIAKLGAVYEGRLRRHMTMPDGYVRDTLMFSVTDEEWPQVRAGLERRLLG